MANYKVFSVRLRHEWLAKPKRKKRIKARSAKRCGLFDAQQRNAKPEPPEAEAAAPVEEQPAEQ
jgi:hypothetical protein